MSTGVSSAPDLAEVLRSWDDARIASLLRHRPDLASPPPTSITALASRATARGSLARALGTLDSPTCVVAEALVLLQPGCTSEAVSSAVGAEAAPYLTILTELALVVSDGGTFRPVPGLAEAVGSHPLGLGPPLGELSVRADAGWPTTAHALTETMARAPDGARRMLEALTWGPPVGTVAHDIPAAARWLLDHHVLVRRSGTELVLPREVGIAARGGRLVRGLQGAPPLAEAPTRGEETVAAESVRAAETLLGQIDKALTAWGQEPPRVLRAGGVGVRELRQLASRISATSERAVLAVELATMLGLVGRIHDDDGTAWAPTVAAEEWAGEEIGERWADLVLGWIGWRRTPWLAGTRDDRGTLRSALGPALERHWAPVLRRRVLAAVAAWPPGSAPEVSAVRERLSWFSARSVPPETAVTAVLAEAGALGLTGAGAVTEAGRALLAAYGDEAERPSPADYQDERAQVRERLAQSFTAQLPPAVEDLILQGDLTGIVPGRPGRALAELLADAAEVESHGAAVTVRFTAGSIRRALERGDTAQELLERLRGVARQVPQPLEYLVHDTARTHGQVRVGAARSYVRVDEATAARLLGAPMLAGLGLRAIAPTVLIARAEPGELVAALRDAGANPVLEAADGTVVAVPVSRARAPHPAVDPDSQDAADGPDATDLDETVRHMRTGEERARRLLADRGTDVPEPPQVLEALRVAARSGTEVELVMAGPRGGTESRTVQPLTVDGGWVRVRDVRRDAEITVAPHRIVAVRPV
ncbi:helicase-associated domain-containing protein [Ruania alkalisoli]|uniref:Helicase-associated domain-containing protein n=1 Tax=Ruania alkalisoli TaxID=2779775 RepID=A0A7M1SWT4_9MICO|nr:helicase-associated domain-containing protein [Ruania alkalisoli]QOR71497.1 helicase-associated domain-containing protein [Ruania alkalisoli]